MPQPPEPASIGPLAPSAGELALVPVNARRYRWYHKVAAVMAAIFCFELGVFLLVYPWFSDWHANASIIPVWGRAVWTSAWFRGAISGLGLLNIYISFTEVSRLKRFSA